METKLHKKLHGKYAFTMAEVLITLAIIGVIAAITIPAVVTKATKQQYVTGVQKAFNTLKQAEREAVRANGAMENWTITLDVGTNFTRYFKPHFDMAKDCGTSTDNGCFADNVSYMGNLDWNFYNDRSSYYKFITPDGIAFAYSQASNSYYYCSGVPDTAAGSFYVDVNARKGPNILGRDIFQFNIFSFGIRPAGAYDVCTDNPKTTENMTEGCKLYGQYCAAKVLAEGAMNY